MRIYEVRTASLGMCAHGLRGTRDYQNIRSVVRLNSPEPPKGAPRRSKCRPLTWSRALNHARTATSANYMRFQQSQTAEPARLLCTRLTSRSKAVGHMQRSLCRRRYSNRHSLLHTRRDLHTAHGGDDQRGHHDTCPWAGLCCAPLADGTGT